MGEDERRKLEDAYSRWSDMLYRIAVMTTRTRADAEDCVSEVFVRLIRHQRGFESEEHEKAWLIRVCINVCKNRVSDFWNRNTQGIAEACPCDRNDFERMEFLGCLLCLSSRERIAVYLKYHENYTAKEIGKFLKLSESGVRTLLFRAREYLRLELSPQDEN